VHAEVSNKELRSWSAVDPSSKLLNAFGDGTTPAGNTHIVAFGANETHLDPEEDIKKTSQILTDLVDMDIKRLVRIAFPRENNFGVRFKLTPRRSFTTGRKTGTPRVLGSFQEKNL
jgi:hypothetical protein